MSGSIYDWSTTAATNATADGDINWAEFQNPDTVNNSARQMMARQREYIRDTSLTITSTGSTANVYQVSLASAPLALVDGLEVSFVPHQSSTAETYLSVNGFGNVPLRPLTGVAHQRNEILTGVPVVAAYRSATNEFIVKAGSGYWLRALGPTYLSSNTFGLKVGDVKLSMSSSPDAGFIRLKETTQSISSSAYPDLYAWLSAQGFPWGSGAGTANLPPAGGYFLRFGATNTTVDPGGARIPGSTASDALKQTTIPSTGLTASTTTTLSPTTLFMRTTSLISVAAGSSASAGAGGSTTIENIAPSSSTSISGSVTLPGGTETAPKSVTMYADMLAVPALVASGLIGVGGFAYKWSTNTATSDPGSGYLKVNNATFTSATALYISETGSNSAPFASILQSLPTGTRFYIVKVGSPSTFVYASLSSTATDNGAWDTFSITPIGTSVAALADGDDVAIVVSVAGTSGSNGATGASGPVPLDYTWDTGTSAADPGVGKVRANNASLSSATALYINKTDRLANNLAATLATFGASTNTTKGLLQIVDLTTPANRAYFTVSSFTDNGSYDTVGVTYLSGATSFAALNVALMFSPTGNKGADGAGSFISLSPGAGTTSDTTANAPGSAITTSGTISAAELVNAQVGTTYTVVDGDRAKLLTLSNAASIAVTLPQAGQTTTFKTGWFVDVVNVGAGTVTITPTTSTINGAATLVLFTGQGCRIVSDGTNYQISSKPVSVVVAAGKQATISNTLTFAGTDSTVMTFPSTSSTVLTTGNSATITKGFAVTPNNIGTVSTGTTTPDPTNGNYQYYTNNGAHTLAAPASDCAIDILVTNGASAGGIMFTGFTASSNVGDALTTTNTSKFIVSIRRINSVATYLIKALQ